MYLSPNAAPSPQVADGCRVAQRPLEMFFPFDPYLLKRSSRHLHLKQSYVRWKHGHASTHAAAAGPASYAGALGVIGTADGPQGGDSDAGEDEDDSDEVGYLLPRIS